MANFNSVQAAARAPQGGSCANVNVAWGTIEIAANNAATSTYTFFTLPKGATPITGWLIGDDLDTGAEELEIDIGVAGNADKYLNSGVLTGDPITGTKPETGIHVQLFGELASGPAANTLTEDTPIIGTVVVDAATGGTGTLNLIMLYTYNDARVSPPEPPL